MVGKKRPPLYNQNDRKWGKIPYTIDKDPDTIGTSGCGPTSMAMVVTALTGKQILPPDLRTMALQHKDRTADTGTAWTFFQHVVEHYTPLKCVQTPDYRLALVALAKPDTYVIASMKPGHFTKGGHYIVLCDKTAAGKIVVNDPGGLAGGLRSKKLWDPNIIKAEAKQYWIISK